MFLEYLFETISAFGTVGLSMGLTPRLDTAGKALITLTMFVGRVGILTLVYLFAQQKAPPRYEYAEENIMIG
jgi:trk system potassium uptake protein TrkH